LGGKGAGTLAHQLATATCRGDEQVSKCG
jgi:hypothetical protein